jgi:hypothetical protein
MRLTRVVPLAVGALFSLACGVSGRPLGVDPPIATVTLSQIDAEGPRPADAAIAQEDVRSVVFDAPPPGIAHPLDVSFENRVGLIGYTFEPASIEPGQVVKLTFFWRCDATLEDGWQLFTHVEDDATGHSLAAFDGVGPLREIRDGHAALGPDRWEAGKFYVDEQTVTVPDAAVGDLSVLVGIWKNDARLRIVKGANDGDNRAIVGKLANRKAGARPDPHPVDVPSIQAAKLSKRGAIKVDGRENEAEWKTAASTGPFVDVATGHANTSFPVDASAKLLWDDDNLYVFVDVKEASFYTGFTNPAAQPGDFTAAGQPKLWIKDTFEMMLEPDADGTNTNYYEIQINPQNRIFKSQFDTLQRPNGGPNGPFGHEDWAPKLKSAVNIRHGANGTPSGYAVEVAIPWSAYGKAAHRPPVAGETWRLNFYATKNNGGVSWSPILGKGNFHFAPRFGRVTWGS